MKTNEKIDWRTIYDKKEREILKKRLYRFKERCLNPVKNDYSLNDALVRIGKNPYCSVTGNFIDIRDISNFSFDHIIPIAQGGSSELDNLGICHYHINRVKGDLSSKNCLSIIKSLVCQGKHIGPDIQKFANKIARKNGYLRATKIVFGNRNGMIGHVKYGYRKKSNGEYVSNAYRRNFGWKNTYYQRAITVVEVDLSQVI